MNLSIVGDRLIVELEWYEQLWAFYWNKTIEIPLANIVRVHTDEPVSSWSELRAPGTSLPGVIKAGTYYTSRGKEFWYVTKEKDYLTIELANESYKRLIFNLDQNETWRDRLNQQIASNP